MEATGVLLEPRRGTGRAQTPLIGPRGGGGAAHLAGGASRPGGPPHLVTVIGQAGVGKSRLLRA